jgi:hypothetical protein
LLKNRIPIGELNTCKDGEASHILLVLQHVIMAAFPGPGTAAAADKFPTANDCYVSVSARFQGFEKGTLRDDSDVLELIQDLNLCKDMVRRADLFSRNEELEEYSTSTLKYLFLDYFLGKSYSNLTDLYVRKERLEQATAYFHAFLEMCIRLQVLTEGEQQEYENQIVGSIS